MPWTFPFFKKKSEPTLADLKQQLSGLIAAREQLREERQKFWAETPKQRATFDSQESELSQEVSSLSRQINAREWVIWEGPLVTYEPNLLENFVAPRARFTIETTSSLTKELNAALQQHSRDNAKKVIAECQKQLNKQIRDIDVGMNMAFTLRPGEDVASVKAQRTREALAEVEQHIRAEVEVKVRTAIMETVQDWSKAQKANLKFKIISGLTIAWNTIKLGRAIASAVASAGADVTAYIDMVIAIKTIATKVKALLQTVDEAWKVVEKHVAKLEELRTDSTARQMLAAVLSERITGEGSLQKLNDDLERHFGKTGGVLREATSLVKELEKLLAQGEAIRRSAVEANIDVRALFASTQQTLEAAQRATTLGTTHLDNNKEAKAFYEAYAKSHRAQNLAGLTARYGPTVVSTIYDAVNGGFDDAISSLGEAADTLRAAG